MRGEKQILDGRRSKKLQKLRRTKGDDKALSMKSKFQDMNGKTRF